MHEHVVKRQSINQLAYYSGLCIMLDQGWGVLKLSSLILPFGTRPDFIKVFVRFYESHSYLTDVTAAKLQWHLSDMKEIFNILIIFRTPEKNGKVMNRRNCVSGPHPTMLALKWKSVVLSTDDFSLAIHNLFKFNLVLLYRSNYWAIAKEFFAHELTHEFLWHMHNCTMHCKPGILCIWQDFHQICNYGENNWVNLVKRIQGFNCTIRIGWDF